MEKICYGLHIYVMELIKLLRPETLLKRDSTKSNSPKFKGTTILQNSSFCSFKNVPEQLRLYST